MRKATAVRHLAEMAAIATENLRLREGPVGWPLQSLWVGGELLGASEAVEDVEVVLLLDLPVDELPWLALHREAEWVSFAVGLGKRPVLWSYRPQAWPPWNARCRRVVRVWDAEDGVDDEALARLRRGGGPAAVEPSDDEWHGQLREERAIARRHLAQVLDRYHDREWRREHKGLGDGPDDHLWRAAQGLREIDEALGS